MTKSPQRVRPLEIGGHSTPSPVRGALNAPSFRWARCTSEIAGRPRALVWKGLVSAVCVFVALGSCKRADPTTTIKGTARIPESTRVAVLSAFATCAASEARAFRDAAAAFEQASMTASSSKTSESKIIAQDAWRSAIDIWERNELLQFGPSAIKSQPGGQDQRENIYPWPLTNRCLLEQQIVSKGYESSGFGSLLTSYRGLGAAEYLLFYEGTDNACGEGATINAQKTWEAVGADLGARKLDYAKAIATDVHTHADALATTWDPEKGNFGRNLSDAGIGSSVYSSQQLAFNVVSDALFYVETDVKDMKVGRPTGLTDCSTPTCPEALESLYAKRSKAHVKNNLVGFRNLMFGCEGDGKGLGFDDLLVAIGAESVATRLKSALDASFAALDAIQSDDFSQALGSELDKMKALHAALIGITDLLRTEFITVLDLELPKRVEGDND